MAVAEDNLISTHYMNIALGISAGIAAYKTAELVRLFIKNGHQVTCIMTENSQNFVTPLVLQTLSQHKVYTEQFEQKNWSPDHISIADWADVFLVAPATANVLGKFANGIADDLLSTTFLAFDKPVVLCPAMNDRMFTHPIVQRNIKSLQQLPNVHVMNPDIGSLACGSVGLGRLPELPKIVEYVENLK